MLNISRVLPTIPVHDLDRAVKFYTEKLGLKHKEMGVSDGVYLEGAGGCDLLLYQTTYDLGGATRISFEVQNLDTAMKDLRNSGVSFEDYDFPGLKTENGVATYEGMRSAWFKDSEGNIIAISEGSRDRSAQAALA